MSYAIEQDMALAELEDIARFNAGVAMAQALDEERDPAPIQTRLGHARTTCNCRDCSRFCDHMPGFLIPEDLAAIVPDDVDSMTYIKAHFVASPGATVGQTQPDGRVKLYQIPTIRPAVKPDGTCVFLDNDGLCSIHDIAPYGCAAFDDHMTRPEGDRRLSDGLVAIHEDRTRNGTYAQAWHYLLIHGKTGQPAAELRDIVG
jgi:Fe-S-cluster containining protein